ncbi:MAG: hypothetical protein RR255_00050 [Bacilli bacterium]
MRNNNFKGVFIEGNRDGYSPEQCSKSLTINELIDELEELKLVCGGTGDEPIYLINDGGYTYGSINYCTIHIGKYIENKGVVFEKQ